MTHVLSVIIWLPIAAAFVLAFFPRSAANTIKALGLFVSLATFIISLTMLQQFQEGIAAFQLVESRAWIPQWGIRYALGVDGISLWLVLLTTLLTPVVFLSSWNTIHKHPKEYVISFLIMEAAMIGVFLATDLVLFYSFFELTLLPMYLVIGVWGGANRIYAAIKFFLFTITGSLLMLLGIIYLGFLQVHQTMTWSFAITDFYGLGLPLHTQSILFGAFALAFAIKVPLFPLHTWLPDAHVEAPTGGSIILAGVMLKMGTYGFLRFVLPFFPDATAKYTPLMLALAVIGVIYGALVSWVQPDMKKLVAYSSVSHLGFCVLGRRALPSRRCGLRATAHPAARGLWRPGAEHAAVRHVLRHRRAVVDRSARTERIRRRVSDPRGLIQDAAGVDNSRDHRCHPRGDLPSVARAACLFRTDHER